MRLVDIVTYIYLL